jgi:hypothetical protein
MKFKLLKYYNYYDCPLDYLAEDEKGNKYLCLIAESTIFIAAPCDDITLESLENEKLDLNTFFSQTTKLYKFNLGSDQYVEAESVPLEYGIKYIPEQGYTL